MEVSEASETFEEGRTARRVSNPYRDRSLLIKIYSLVKEFCVDFALEATRPTILIEVSDLNFDADFVLANGDFLEDYLLDRRLALALPEALEAVLDRNTFEATKEVERLALLALRYLFDVPNIFNVRLRYS